MGILHRLKPWGRNFANSASASNATELDVLSLLNEGNAFEQEGRLEDALLRIEKVIQIEPTLGLAHFYRGNILLAQGQAVNAITAYEKALELKPDSATAHYNKGNALIYLSRYEDAVIAYQQAIHLKPDFADAEVALASALDELGQFENAIAHYHRALKIKPDYIQVYGNLAQLLKKLGQLDEALVCYRQALRLQPEDAQLHFNVANTLNEWGQFEEAIANYRTVLTIQPDSVEAHNNLGTALKNIGRLEDAVASYKKALDIQPEYAEAHSNLGVALKGLGRLESAVASYKRALDIQPELAEVHSNLGVALKGLGQLESSMECYKRALKINPNFPEVHINLGGIFQELGEAKSAISSYRCALQINPSFAVAHSNIGVSLQELGQFENALVSFKRALELDPDYAEAHNNLGHTLKDLGQFSEALTSIRKALEIKPDYTSAHSNLLFIQSYLDNQPAPLMLTEAQHFGEVVARQAQPYSTWNTLPDPNRCLRIGLVSGDLGDHPVGYFIEGVLSALASHAAGRLEFFAYSTRVCHGIAREKIKACCHGWHSTLGLSDERLAQQIHNDQIDILIDLSGHTAHNRLAVFAWKAAPIQASWLGYFATTGVAAMDYLIADPLTLPPSEEIAFTEAIWRLPDTRLCFTPPNFKIDVSPLPALSNGHITFGCFNNLSKMNEDVVRLWSKILTAIPSSRLFLKAPQFMDSSTHHSITKRFFAYGIDPTKLILERPAPRSEYLAAYQRIDIALDPFPYPGGTTTVEALWMGVPVLTLSGKRFLARQGAGLLMNAGLPDWVAANTEDYVTRAVTHASDLQRLAALRSRLRAHVLASPIFDAPRFAKNFESALRDMWKIWCEKQG